MPYQANVFKVMIASPGDVNEEKEVVKKIIEEWNITDAEKEQLVLLPVSWDTHSSPQEGLAAQEGINEQVLKGCDLLIAIFWTRIGTPTQQFQSGTVEEIERHIRDGKSAMIYFMKKRILYDHDPDQLKSVNEFKKNRRIHGMQWECNNSQDLENNFRRHLRLEMQKPYFVTESIRSIDGKAEGIKDVLKAEEKILLLAAKRHKGELLCQETFAKMFIGAGAENFVKKDDHRSKALWESALKGLVEKGLIKDVGSEGQIYKLTTEGYNLCDEINEIESNTTVQGIISGGVIDGGTF